MIISYNKYWEQKNTQRVSIITPVYNRRNELPRALSSVEVQSCKDLEHIVVDDGSTEGIDDIMEAYMERVPYPVAYIKKSNGGVHTARNAGIRISRGELMLFLDSDDEIVPDNIKIYTAAWDSIPSEIKSKYRECNAFCRDETGKRVGLHLPEGINHMPYEMAMKAALSAKQGEQTAILRGDIMRANLWPEPEGVTFVSEGIMWLALGAKYKTWFLDDELRIYHRDTVSLCRPKDNALSNQKLINRLYNQLWYVNNGRAYGKGVIETIKNIISYCITLHMLRRRRMTPHWKWVKVDGFFNKVLVGVLWMPSLLYSFYYQRRS